MIGGLPEKLKELRSKYHLSQREVARSLGVSPSIISGYETGERTPSAENILALASLYRCSTDFLLGRDICKSYPISLEVNGLTSRQIQLIAELIEMIRKQ